MTETIPNSSNTRADTLAAVKINLRITTEALDTELDEQVSACLADLAVCGIAEPDETDPLILNAIKLWCRREFTDDTAKAEAYLKRYDAMKACLMMAAGYGGADDVAD